MEIGRNRCCDSGHGHRRYVSAKNETATVVSSSYLLEEKPGKRLFA